MVPVNWRMSVEGESVLSCSLIIPTEYEGTTTLGTTDLVSASQVEWEPREEGTPNLFFPILIALIIGIADSYCGKESKLISKAVASFCHRVVILFPKQLQGRAIVNYCLSSDFVHDSYLKCIASIFLIKGISS